MEGAVHHHTQKKEKIVPEKNDLRLEQVSHSLRFCFELFCVYVKVRHFVYNEILPLCFPNIFGMAV